jgi:hypothetical protein
MGTLELDALADQIDKFLIDSKPGDKAMACLILAGRILGKEMAKKPPTSAHTAGFIGSLNLFTTQVGMELANARHPMAADLVVLSSQLQTLTE